MEEKIKKAVTIVMAEDDDADWKLAKRVFDKLHLTNEVVRVKDGQELLDHLKNHDSFKNRENKKACLILLDLNMPKKDGREALAEMKEDPVLKHIPVIIMTTSKAEEDVVRSYQVGANAYIRKPIKQEDFLDVMTVFKKFWLEIIELPFVE